MLLKRHWFAGACYRHICCASKGRWSVTTRAYHQGNTETIEETEEAQESYVSELLYATHIPTSSVQKALLAFGSSLVGLLNPSRADLVAVSGETTGGLILPHLRSRMRADPEGCRILRDRPVINSSTVDLEALSQLPDGTLGREYIRFLAEEHVTPDSRDPVRFVDDPELAYVMQRYRESHDLVHTALGMPTTLLGEVTVKWVEGLQTGLPMCLGGGVLAPLRLKPKHRRRYFSEYLPWALNTGRTCKPLLNVYWERRWEQDLQQLRQELGIPAPPGT